MSLAQVRAHNEEGIAVLEIDHPAVNALSHPVRTGLLAAMTTAAADPAVRAIVIHGVGRCFVAGADLHEFERAPLEPLLNDILLQLEACPKLVVAALHGATLGGGLELALACHYRCATADVSLGFPEIKVGLLPGSGGTQRLPRLVGPAVALEMMLRGAPVSGERAVELGLIDRRIEGEDVLAGAIAFARELLASGAPPRRLRDRQTDRTGLDPELFAKERARSSAESAGLLASGYIIECVEAALTQPFDVALALSRRRFEECRTSVASRALRHLFFAERPRSAPAGAFARPVRRVAVVGAGTMGSGIALSLASAGYETVVIESDAAALDAGMKRIESTIAALAAKGRLSAAAASSAKSRLTSSQDLTVAASAALVIEAVFESLTVKQEVFRSLDQCCEDDAVLASNTSTLDIDAIASATGRPQAVIGMHFFSPAHIMRLIEIVKGRLTSADVIATALAVTKQIGKLGVVVGNGFGFVGNRMLYAYGRENQLMLLEGASPTQIDSALREFGMAMGPNAVGDLAGLDVGYRVRRERRRDRPDDPRYYRIADALVEAGRLGQKSGRGAFRYEAGSRDPHPDPEVDALIAAEAARLGIRRRPIEKDEIIERCIYALINEGARLLGEGIAGSAADIDAIWCNGYGFPRLRGGPMFYADTLGLSHILATIERYASEHGTRYWSAAPLLMRLADAGGRLTEWDANAVSALSRLTPVG